MDREERQRKNTVWVLFGIVAVVLVLLDVRFNPALYGNQTDESVPSDINQPDITLTTVRNDNTNATELPTNVNSAPNTVGIVTSAVLQNAGLSNAIAEDAKVGKEIFSLKVDTLKGPLVKRYLRQDDFPLGILYESDQSNSYDDLKNAIQSAILNSPVWSMNESNTFGSQSLYVNNTNRPDTTFLLIRFNTVVIGFEYPKTNHPTFLSIFEQLKNMY